MRPDAKASWMSAFAWRSGSVWALSRSTSPARRPKCSWKRRTAPASSTRRLRPEVCLRRRAIMSPRKARLSQQDGEPGAELDGHGFVVGGAQAQGGTAVCGLAIGKLEDAEE